MELLFRSATVFKNISVNVEIKKKNMIVKSIYLPPKDDLCIKKQRNSVYNNTVSSENTVSQLFTF
jgi:hypothetical protein